MGFVRRNLLFWAALGLVAGTEVACTPEPDNEYEPVSGACLACLTTHEKDGCKTQFDACEGVSSCDDYVICQLMGRCFERKSNSSCEQELGCREPDDKPSDEVDGSALDAGEANSPRDLAHAVERCARSTCADICGFVDE